MSETAAAPTPPAAPPRPSPQRWLPWFALPLGLVIVSDLWSKYALFARYREGESFSWWGELTYNTGVAWGLGNRWPGAVLALTLLLIPVLTALWWWQYRLQGRLTNLAFGMILGGACGNAYDRCMMWLVGPSGGYKGVRDFIRIDLNMLGINYVWPNFNLADAAISLGFILLIALSFLPVKSGSSR